MMSVVWFAFVALILVVGAVDLATYRIPNWTWLALCALFAVVWLAHGTNGTWLEHLGAAAVVLVSGLIFFFAKQMGAGDAKVLTAVALFSGFSAMVPLLFWIAVAALIELTVIIVLRRAAPRFQSMFLTPGLPLPRVLTKKQAIPLGAGIAMGAIVASFWFPSWLWFV